ncbi:MAG: ABC transporter ATP-binding protein [Rikenellaceae bacterium]|nr:ABC transporter ATP-binding protein [Rikenellaceae bacterium]
MKTYFRLFQFSRPISRYAIPYFFSVLIHTIFNTFNFVMLIPILDTLFVKDKAVEAVTTPPALEFSTESLDQWVNYLLYLVYGPEYSVMQVLVLLSLFLVLSFFMSNISRYFAQRTMENFRIHTLQNLRNGLFNRIMSLHVGFFTNERKGDIISKITSDVQVVQFCITNTLQVVFREPFLIIGYFVMLMSISVHLTLFTLMVLPVAALVISRIVKRLKQVARKTQDDYGQLVSCIDESVSGVKVIKSYNILGYIIEKFASINGSYSKASRAMARRQQLASPASEFMSISIVAVIMVYGGNMVLDGDIEASAFLAYVAAFSQLTRPVRAIADAFSTIHQGLAAAERVFELYDTTDEIPEKENAKKLVEFNNQIEFRNVSFSYSNNKTVIDNISFTVEKGQTVALVGASGGGKSTIANLIPRFYDVNAGQILIDGVDIRDYTLHSLRDNIGLVTQDIVLFNDTIEQNIRLGKLNATQNEIENAAKIANAFTFIQETENGFDTNIGDRGMKLSGGQCQRLSIARAVLKNPNILILDEATSALDTESEKLVQEALSNLLKGRTSLVIAHRLSTIQHANKIIVLDHGRIIEQGTHTELMDKNGVYSKLISMQQLD